MVGVKRNQTFNYLYVMAIIMVIDDHCSSRIGFLTSIFPYNSFYMPLFVFISGYFFVYSEFGQFFKRKCQKLLLPYLVWNVVASIVAFVLDKVCGTNWGPPYSFPEIVNSLIYGSPTTLNGQSWFVIMLFWVSIIYSLIRTITKQGWIKDLVLTIVFISLGFYSVHLCVLGYSQINDSYLFLLRTAFYIQFYHLGHMFRLYAEKWLMKCNRVAVCSICVLINCLLVLKFDVAISFHSTSEMASFKFWYLPLLTSITGITFYYEVMSYLSSKIGPTRLTDIISKNTFIILECHMLFCNIPNFYCYHRYLLGDKKYLDFPVETFIYSAQLRYSPNSRLISFICGVVGSVLVVILWERIKAYMNQKLQF